MSSSIPPRNSTLSSEGSSHEASQSSQNGSRGSSTDASWLIQGGGGENGEENIEGDSNHKL